jgi:hypothetical protein
MNRKKGASMKRKVSKGILWVGIGLFLVSISVPASFCQNKPDDKMSGAMSNAWEMLRSNTDKNQDGKISWDEFSSIYKDEARADQNFQFWDKNKDGYITKDEYVMTGDQMRSRSKPNP